MLKKNIKVTKGWKVKHTYTTGVLTGITKDGKLLYRPLLKKS